MIVALFFLPETFQSLLVGISKTNILCFLPAPKSANLMVDLDLEQEKRHRNDIFTKCLPLYLGWTDNLGLSHSGRQDRVPRFSKSVLALWILPQLFTQSLSLLLQWKGKKNFLESCFHIKIIWAMNFHIFLPAEFSMKLLQLGFLTYNYALHKVRDISRPLS